ncbi:hypothetical protein GCM10009689_01770 [Brevibacterium antiquum]|uniref:hypothetical protein n=1 Tax=Brevibacterium antiquum TaxID=234835 RepID=UPI0018E02A6A|nr:hypothetical protein [Brevibacterium antiquum]
MKKLIAITASAALVALTGCGARQPVAKPVEQAVDTQASELATEPTETKQDTKTYSLQDENGTVYTLDLSGYSDKRTDAADNAIAEAMASEGDVNAEELEGITEWASLTIDNTKSDMESGVTYVDIKIVGDEMQYEIITDPSEYVAELTWMSEYGDNAEPDTYNRMLDVADALIPTDTIKPGVKETYPIVLATGLPETIESVWCWDLEMKP